MMKFIVSDKDSCIEAAGFIKFRSQDEIEARQFGNIPVIEHYKMAAQYPFTRWFQIVDDEDGNNICAIIALKRDGMMTFFANSNIKNKIAFIRELKNIADWYTSNYETTIFTRTASWYDDANRINKIVGFRILVKGDNEAIWVYEKDR